MLGFIRFQCQLSFLADLFVARDVGLIERALRMNAIARIGGLAAIGAKTSRLLRDNGYRLENTHVAPDCPFFQAAKRQTESTASIVKAAIRHVVYGSLYSSRIELRKPDILSTRCILREIDQLLGFALDLHPRTGTMNRGWYSERVSAAGSFCVGWLLFFRPDLLAGLQITGPFLCSPESEMKGCTYFPDQEMHHGKEIVLR